MHIFCFLASSLHFSWLFWAFYCLLFVFHYCLFPPVFFRFVLAAVVLFRVFCDYPPWFHLCLIILLHVLPRASLFKPFSCYNVFSSSFLYLLDSRTSHILASCGVAVMDPPLPPVCQNPSDGNINSLGLITLSKPGLEHQQAARDLNVGRRTDQQLQH